MVRLICTERENGEPTIAPMDLEYAMATGLFDMLNHELHRAYQRQGTDVELYGVKCVKDGT